MAIIATSFRRQLAMAILLTLAIGGAAIRYYAPNPSTLRDVGTLLLVMWLPAVGNLIAYLVRKMPKRPTRSEAGFAADAAFTGHLRVQLQAIEAAAQVIAGIDPLQQQCAVLVGPQAFTARLDRPVVEAIADASSQADAVALQLLRPEVALQHLAVGTAFHLVVHSTAVATGTVVGVIGAAGELKP